jgi:hypothetical protein
VIAMRTSTLHWVDHSIREAARWLGAAGFSSSAKALESAPLFNGDRETLGELRSRVNAAVSTVLAAKEIPWTRPALLAVLAAQDALWVAGDELTPRNVCFA